MSAVAPGSTKPPIMLIAKPLMLFTKKHYLIAVYTFRLNNPSPQPGVLYV